LDHRITDWSTAAFEGHAAMSRAKDLLTPLTKTRLHEDIVDQLKDRIVRGDLAPGAKLPTERELAEQLEVNRTTVREALHKLEGMGLVEVKHGTGIFVRDYLESGSLDLARHLLFRDGRLNVEVMQNLLGLRRLLVPEISFHAAKNRSDHDLRELERVVFQSASMPLEERDWRVHNLIARASGNVLFVIFLNSFTKLAQDSAQLYFDVEANRTRSVQFHAEIYDAIKRRKANEAKELMADVLEFAEEQTLAALGVTAKRGKK
jgi:GntR family transcriptional repressor for pyruvate dehydrogenase complex